MKRKTRLFLLLSLPALGGCAVQAALAAADLARYVELPEGPSNAHLRPAAIEACTTRAARHGSVFVVDVEQRRRDRITMLGSVTGPQQRRRTFECHFTTKITAFKLGQILPAD